MKKKIKIIIPVFLFLLVILSVLSYFNVIPGPFAKDKGDEYVYSGTAEADEVNITSELTGKIKEVKVQEGQKVSSGDLVAVIDPSEASIKLEQSEIALKSAQNDLGKVNEGSREEEIKAQQALVSQAQSSVRQGEALIVQSQNNLNAAQLNYDYKLKLYQTTKALYDAGAEAKITLDNTQNALDNAKNTLDNSSASLKSANAQLEGFKAQLNAAQQRLNLLVNGQTERNKATAEFGVDVANKNYELSKLNLNKSSIISSLNGVVQNINYSKGEYVTPGAPIATLLNTESMYVKIYIPEKMLPMIKLDKEVTLKSDFIEDKIIKGSIVYISPEAEFTPMNIVTKKDRAKLVFAVKVKILDNLDLIKPGMLLDVDLGQ